MSENRILIIALNNHPNLGPVLIPYFARTISAGVIEAEEQATFAQKKRHLSETERQIISIAESYSEKNLMQLYSRERVVTEFLRKMTDAMRKELIRSFIDKKLREMIRLVRETGLPIYHKDAGNKVLYEHSRIEVPPTDAEASFFFEITPDLFRYAATCRMNDNLVSLQKKKPVMILSAVPAMLLLGNELLIFKQIRVARLTPFLDKNYVEVPATEARRYMEKIALPVISRYPTTSKGFDMVQDACECSAELSVEKAIDGQPVLQLRFRYGDRYFWPGQSNQFTYPRLTEQEGKLGVSYFVRDIGEEEKHVALLKQWGFKQITDMQFAWGGNLSGYALIEWMKEHREEIQASFSLTKTETGLSFYLGEVCLKQEIHSAPDWFDIRITVQIDEFQFPFISFRKHILESKREFVLPDGRIVLLPIDWFEKYNDLFTYGDGDKEEIRVRKMHLGIVAALEKENEAVQKEYIRKEQIPVPPKIKTTLRSYQQDGFSWLVHLSANGFGGCLADDMGLGKTLQTITLLQYTYDPAEPEKIELKPGEPDKITIDQTGQLSLFGESMPDEVEYDDVVSYRTAEKGQSEISASLIVVPTSLLPNWKKEIRKFSSLSVKTYTGDHKRKEVWKSFCKYNIILITYGLLRRDIELLENYPFNYVILDESQNIKNPGSMTYHSVVRLQSAHRLVLTGTPIENSLKDLWAQFNFINPGLLGSSDGFKNHYINPIVKEGNEKVNTCLQEIIRPFFLRRTKLQVAPELPPLTEEVIYCEMMPEQQEIYQKEKNALRNTILEEWGKNSFVALNGITRLRQLANHPLMVDPDYTGGSGKMDQIIDAYETLLSEGHKVLIFSSFVTHLKLLADAFAERGWQYAMLTGSTADREGEITRFSSQSKVSAFFISLKAGGVGLNLTDADYVFIIDPWWNPAAEMQAESRAHRIGQEKQVIVYRFITADTIEEKIRNLQESKSELAASIITENDPLKQLTDKEWADLL